MSSDLYFYDTSSLYHNSSPEIVSSDGDLFFPDPFSPFCDSDFFPELSSNTQNNQNPFQNSVSLPKLTPIAPNPLSSSPPSQQLESLSLYSSNGGNLGNCSSLPNGYTNFSGFNSSGIKSEGFDFDQQFFMPENVTKMMQRRSNSFEGKPEFLFQPMFDSLFESPNYQNQNFSPPESSFLSSQMRRVCSTGDLQSLRGAHSGSTQRSYSSPLATESSVMEDGNFKVGRYSAEERKDRISKYRAKRNQRNFTKTIKYACRKTLADNRPRIRGRFARNDESGEITKAACSSTRHEDEDELWFDGVHGEEDDGGHGGGGGKGRGYGESYGQTQFQYCTY
ncbi:zinc finger protein CONSTANS-LIKE 2 [Euphorbia lathyris]|uniref:zinc finger protein CONSTANS-LIKE 2 n=1 Tax=Euphorbia lathyris TaxID=212925 RepID=UPI003313DA3F